MEHEKGGIYDYELFEAVQTIVACVLACAKRAGIVVADQRMESVNPWFRPTERGIYMQCYRGMPVALWTPWGEFCFCGDFYICGSPYERREFLKKVLSMFTATLYIEERCSIEEGSFGPVYAMHEVNGIDLPTPEPLPPVHRISCKEAEEALALWAQFKEQYLEKASQ